MMNAQSREKLVALAAAIGVTVSPNATDVQLERAGEKLIEHKRYRADMVLEAQDVHVRIVAIQYGGYVMLGGVENVDGVWLTTQGEPTTLHVIDLVDSKIVGQVGGPVS